MCFLFVWVVDGLIGCWLCVLFCNFLLICGFFLELFVFVMDIWDFGFFVLFCFLVIWLVLIWIDFVILIDFGCKVFEGKKGGEVEFSEFVIIFWGGVEDLFFVFLFCILMLLFFVLLCVFIFVDGVDFFSLLCFIILFFVGWFFFCLCCVWFVFNFFELLVSLFIYFLFWFWLMCFLFWFFLCLFFDSFLLL